MNAATLQQDLFTDEAHGQEPPTMTTDATGRTVTTREDHAHVLYRCRHCERQQKRSQVWRSTFTRTITRTEWWNPSVHKLVRFMEITWNLPDGRTHRGEYAPASTCRTCARPTSGQPIRGTFNAACRCDARCIYAKGPNCECSCGGANHGIGHQH